MLIDYFNFNKLLQVLSVNLLSSTDLQTIHTKLYYIFYCNIILKNFDLLNMLSTNSKFKLS